MERLTDEEIKNCYDYHSQGRGCGKTLLLRTCNELLEYKAREKELGIDLITLIKAQTSLELFFIDLEETNYGYIFSMSTSDCSFNLFNKTLHICGDEKDYDFADYGKTWALDKQTLEKQ